jgi:hypothetical protein
LTTSAPPVGWLDFEKDHKFFCGPLHEEDFSIGEELEYEIKIVDDTTGISSKMDPEDRQTVATKNTLLVRAEYFKINRMYTITCRVTHPSLNVIGGAKIRYNTFDLEEDFEFTVEA